MRTIDQQAHAKARHRILDAARAIFAEKGYHGASMNDVARGAGLGKAALYHYFPSKQALMQALHTELWAGTEARIASLPRFASLKEALRYAGLAYLAHFADAKALQMTRIAFNMGTQDKALRDSSVALVRPDMEAHTQTVFGPFFKGGTPTGQVHLFATQFFGSLFYHVFVLRSLFQDDDLPVTQTEYLDQLVEIYAAGARRIGGR